jgi:hypothetical protein
VFPVRYGLNSHILFRRNSVFKVLIALPRVRLGLQGNHFRYKITTKMIYLFSSRMLHMSLFNTVTELQ